MKYVLIIGDGMADDPQPLLNGKTPLQYANTPSMDKLANAGTLGSALTVPKDMTPGSDTAILSIFGCDPAVFYGGRAPLEAAAKGIALGSGDIAYRCNLVAFEDGDMPFEEKKILSHSAGAIDGDLADKILEKLLDMQGFREALEAAGMEIFPSGSFRHIAVQRKNTPLSHNPAPPPLTLAPPHDHIGKAIGGLLPQAGDGGDCKAAENAKTLTSLIRMAHSMLDDHPINSKRRAEGKLPANGIWFWADGAMTTLPSFADKYGKTGAVISAVPLCQGIGMLMGLSIIVVPGATGELLTNYEGKVDAAAKTLKTHDFAAIHIEAPDECTHNGDLQGKLQAIEWIDSRIITPLTERLDSINEDYRMLIISDHKTLLCTRGHDGDKVPYIIYDSREKCTSAVSERTVGTRRPDARAAGNTSYRGAFASAVHTEKKLCFSEADASKGNYIEDGTRLMEMLFDDNYR
ncbi:MAG: 2,3-bisphosphoglycerate-independent phosphoglycerate mutase [Oscillospiraceae bacterium]|nr:2,3-bisphosphoglycerate-independent phosphoglycerate mutase [Oscillospiraceae bacterium]